MIGKLTGLVDAQGVETVILDVAGSAIWSIAPPARSPACRGPANAPRCPSRTHVCEDMIRLYGFGSELERDWFRLLQGVQGVGAKVALAILGTLATGELALAIAGGDRTAVARSPGVGPKLAARIVAELKDKGPLGAPGDMGFEHPGAEPLPRNAQDAVSALANLGYGRPQAAAAVATAVATLGEAAGTAALIRAGLKHLAS